MLRFGATQSPAPDLTVSEQLSDLLLRVLQAPSDQKGFGIWEAELARRSQFVSK